MMKVMNSAFIVDNLSASAFLNVLGTVIKIASEILQDRPSGITFPALIAGLIQLNNMLAFSKTHFAFNFHCNSHSSILIPSLTKWKILAHQQKIYSVFRKKSRRSLRNYWKSISVFSTPERTGTRNTQTSGSSQNPPTPKMSVLFKNGTNIKIGYFGKLEFLDNQTTFTEVFGDKPTILVPNIDIYQDSTSIARSLYSFGEKCNLDVFLYMCRKYYVGHDSIDNLLSVQDVCRQISEIKQEWKNKNGILMQYSPDPGA